jgi:hypothetical protein
MEPAEGTGYGAEDLTTFFTGTGRKGIPGGEKADQGVLPILMQDAG